MDNETLKRILKYLIQIKFVNMDKALDLLLDKINDSKSLEKLTKEILDLESDIKGL